MDNDILDRLNNIFPCREKQIITLNHLIGNVDETLPECIFIYGNTSTGKTTIIKRFLSENNTNHVIVNLIECFSNKLIFESVLNKFTNHSLVSNAYKPYVKCDNVYDFTTELIKANDEDGDLTPFIIVFDKVERLRSNELLLSVFLRLQEITKLNICVIMLSDIIFEHFFPTSLKSPIKVYFPHYTKDELLTILTINFESEKSYIENKFNRPFDVNINFYKNYINIVLSVFYRACRDISEIKYVAHLNFKHYCEPVIKKILDENDVSGLWRNISPYLKSSLNILYLRFNTESDLNLKETKNGDELNRNIALTLELPFYAKYLLIAAYLASYNPIKEDKRLFMKYHGKKRNNKKRIESKQIVSEKTNIMLGPKMFTLDRLLAIFYAIVDEQVPLTSNLLVQLSSLVELKLLNLVGNDIDLSNHKYRCLVAYEFIETISKMVAHCYPEDLKTFPQLLMDLLQAHNTVLDPAIRMALCRGLILLRNKNLLAPTDLLSLFFQLLRCQDKNLRTFLETHIITDIKNVNAKHKNVKLNKTLQNFMYTMLRDNNSKAAKMSIDIMIELYKKNVWNDTKTVNVISTACFSKVTKVMVAALKFFLSVDSDEKGSDDSDSSDDEPNAKEVMMANKVNKKTRKRNKQLEKVKKLVTKSQKKKSQAPSFNFSALQLIHDPQDFAEKLFKQLESTNERFEVKLMHLDVISRLIGLHDLILLNFYPYIQRYLQPHQREVTRLLQFAAQASHELVPPDCLEPLLRTLVNNFVTERNSSDVIAIGLNAVREICARCPLVMTVDLLGDLTQYKNYRDKSVMMAARSLIGIYRNIAPEMLHKRDRGRPTEATIDLKLKQFGEVIPKDTVPGAEILLEDKQTNDNEENSDEDSDSDGWEDVSHSSDDDEAASELESEEDENKSGDMETEETKDEDIADKSSKAKEIVLDRLLTDEDFKRIEIANIKKQVQIVKKGEKRKLEAENNSPLVKLADIENIYKKRKHDKQTRIESVRKGQEGRDKFGYKDGRVNEFCSKTNREKQKKKNFQMIRHKARGKVKRSFKDKQIALRNHLLHLKKMK